MSRYFPFLPVCFHDLFGDIGVVAARCLKTADILDRLAPSLNMLFQILLHIIAPMVGTEDNDHGFETFLKRVGFVGRSCYY